MLRTLTRLFSLLFFLSAGHAQAVTLHAILVADFEDSTIGDTTQKDVEEWHRRLTAITNVVDIEFCPAIFIHSNYDPALVRSYLNELEVGPDDIIFFQFSGHGFRTLAETTDWPALQFSNKGLRGAEVIETIRKKPSRLNLIFFDCCNILYPPWNMPNVYNYGVRALFNKRVEDGLKKLFLKSEGTFAMAAAEPGMIALGGKQMGGRFTSTLINCIDIGCMESRSWEYILDWAAKRLKNQKPVYAVYKEATE